MTVERWVVWKYIFFFFSSRRRHTRYISVTGVQTCALPIYRLEGRKILIVDDDFDIRSSVEAGFKYEGAETITCSDGNSAVRLCAEKKPELVILDMMLPGRSGFLVLEKIKGYEDSPLVIMITANEGKRHKVFAEGLGAELYLQKPVSLEILIESAVDLLEKDEKERDAKKD